LSQLPKRRYLGSTDTAPSRKGGRETAREKKEGKSKRADKGEIRKL
jgi:hypothetical protein